MAAFLAPFAASARGLELAVTPTLFEMAAVPGQVWRSQVKAVNTNPYPITVYARVMNFAPQGEAGQGKFIPIFENFTEGSTLAEWIDISTESVVIPAEESAQIPFTVRVPDDASPGGHFAAIMISTQPPQAEGMRVTTAQIVTSLFFARIAGDVIEAGDIREFRSDGRFFQTPEATFFVRFENQGNVHIQPQGQIEIYNMWGKERGVIPINRTTHFGNVLPNSIRQFEFTWRGEQSLSDIGRYKAVLTLGYGIDSRKFATSTTYFYVVPLKALTLLFGSVLLGFWFAAWAIKAYVRRMLALSGLDTGDYKHTRRPLVREGDVLIEKRRPRVEAPLKSGWQDLTDRLKQAQAIIDRLRALLGFVRQYKLFFLSLLGFAVLFVVLFIFVREVSQEQKDYEVTIDNAGSDITLSSEEIIYEQKHEQTESTVVSEVEVSTTTVSAKNYTLDLINAGDTPGAAAALKAVLTAEGILVSSVSSDFNDSRERTVVIYAPGLEAEALTISQLSNNALLSADPSASDSITVYIGNDFDFE